MATVRVPNAEIEWRKVQREILSPAKSHRRAVVSWFALPAAVAAAITVGFYIASKPTPEKTSVALANAATPTRAEAVEVAPPSTVVFVDDKSGWTFVWGSDNGGNGQQHI